MFRKFEQLLKADLATFVWKYLVPLISSNIWIIIHSNIIRTRNDGTWHEEANFDWQRSNLKSSKSSDVSDPNLATPFNSISRPKLSSSSLDRDNWNTKKIGYFIHLKPARPLLRDLTQTSLKAKHDKAHNLLEKGSSGSQVVSYVGSEISH